MAIAANAIALKGLVILLADGRLYSRALMRSMLSQLEIKAIHEAVDGATAIDVICAVNPDVMIVDWDLPVLNVRDMLRMVRTSSTIPNPNLPIIVVSSSGQSADVHDAIKLGAQQFMVRPISPKMLEQRLRSIVKAARKARGYNIEVTRPREQPEVLDSHWQIIEGR
jgi:two-component system chemotaxis response regulator CheY